jgi:E3 ubiquitin-protein ligase SHPRH
LPSSSEDMLAILFPHLFEDLEYLVPPEHDMTMDDVVVTGVVEELSQMHVNAEAGPSRSR